MQKQNHAIASSRSCNTRPRRQRIFCLRFEVNPGVRIVRGILAVGSAHAPSALLQNGFALSCRNRGRRSSAPSAFQNHSDDQKNDAKASHPQQKGQFDACAGQCALMLQTQQAAERRADQRNKDDGIRCAGNPTAIPLALRGQPHGLVPFLLCPLVNNAHLFGNPSPDYIGSLSEKNNCGCHRSHKTPPSRQSMRHGVCRI